MSTEADRHIELAVTMLDSLAETIVATVDGDRPRDQDGDLDWTFSVQLAGAHALVAIALTMAEERAWIEGIEGES
jgi:hypothetical protein